MLAALRASGPSSTSLHQHYFTGELVLTQMQLFRRDAVVRATSAVPGFSAPVPAFPACWLAATAAVPVLQWRPQAANRACHLTSGNANRSPRRGAYRGLRFLASADRRRRLVSIRYHVARAYRRNIDPEMCRYPSGAIPSRLVAPQRALTTPDTAARRFPARAVSRLPATVPLCHRTGRQAGERAGARTDGDGNH